MIRAVIACDGQTTAGPCRQAHPVGPVTNGAHARRIAAAQGWTTRLDAATPLATAGAVVDLCPACRRRWEATR